MRHSKTIALLNWASVTALTSISIWGQGITNGGMQYSQNIIMPNWTNTGTTQANFDLFAFNPKTRIMYVADRGNHGIAAIDTRSNVAIGYMTMPNNSSPNGVLVAPDLQKLAVTDGGKSLWVWDLRLPGTDPVQYVLPNIGSTTDAFDYDPYNKTVYLINGSAPYYISGVNLVTQAVTSQLKLPGSPELNRFNSYDGLIYQVITDNDNKNAGAGVVAYDPVANAIVATYLTANCVPHGIDIDPVSNVALLGCGTNQGQIMMNLKDGTIMKQFSDVTGSDLLVFNPNNRRFYTGSSSNVATTSTCSADSTKAIPIVGIFDGLMSGGVPVPRLDGVACTGRNGHGLGVDTIENFVYVGSRQWPVDPASATTGLPGVLVYIDSTPPAQPLTAKTQAILKSLGSNTATATVNTAIDGRVVRIDASPAGISGKTALLVFSTTVGYESVDCAVGASGAAVCGGDLVGDPLVGSMVTLAVDGVPAARGKVAAAQ